MSLERGVLLFCIVIMTLLVVAVVAQDKGLGAEPGPLSSVDLNPTKRLQLEGGFFQLELTAEGVGLVWCTRGGRCSAEFETLGPEGGLWNCTLTQRLMWGCSAGDTLGYGADRLYALDQHYRPDGTGTAYRLIDSVPVWGLTGKCAGWMQCLTDAERGRQTRLAKLGAARCRGAQGELHHGPTYCEAGGNGRLLAYAQDWAEAVGRALYYAGQGGQLVLVMETASDYPQVRMAERALAGIMEVVVLDADGEEL